MLLGLMMSGVVNGFTEKSFEKNWAYFKNPRSVVGKTLELIRSILGDQTPVCIPTVVSGIKYSYFIDLPLEVKNLCNTVVRLPNTKDFEGKYLLVLYLVAKEIKLLNTVSTVLGNFYSQSDSAFLRVFKPIQSPLMFTMSVTYLVAQTVSIARLIRFKSAFKDANLKEKIVRWKNEGSAEGRIFTRVFGNDGITILGKGEDEDEGALKSELSQLANRKIIICTIGSISAALMIACGAMRTAFPVAANSLALGSSVIRVIQKW